jgi:hypothetical protein
MCEIHDVCGCDIAVFIIKHFFFGSVDQDQDRGIVKDVIPALIRFPDIIIHGVQVSGDMIPKQYSENKVDDSPHAFLRFFIQAFSESEYPVRQVTENGLITDHGVCHIL